MKKRRIPEHVKQACKDFMLARNLPIGQYSILIGLALQSYKNMPIGTRHNWTMEQIIIQGL